MEGANTSASSCCILYRLPACFRKSKIYSTFLLARTLADLAAERLGFRRCCRRKCRNSFSARSNRSLILRHALWAKISLTGSGAESITRVPLLDLNLRQDHYLGARRLP